jgi:hypothetical protein
MYILSSLIKEGKILDNTRFFFKIKYASFVILYKLITLFIK